VHNLKNISLEIRAISYCGYGAIGSGSRAWLSTRFNAEGSGATWNRVETSANRFWLRWPKPDVDFVYEPRSVRKSSSFAQLLNTPGTRSRALRQRQNASGSARQSGLARLTTAWQCGCPISRKAGSSNAWGKSRQWIRDNCLTRSRSPATALHKPTSAWPPEPQNLLAVARTAIPVAPLPSA